MGAFKPIPKSKRKQSERPSIVGTHIRLMATKPTSARKRKRRALDKLGTAGVAQFNERERAKPSRRRRANIEAREFRYETITRNRQAKEQPLVRPEFAE